MEETNQPHILGSIGEYKKDERLRKRLTLLQKQNKILMITVIVAVVGIVITALVGVGDLILRIYFNK